MRWIAALAAAMLLAGCSDLNDAADDAQAKLDEAQREAAEAQARYERVRSATIVREETLELTLTARVANGTLSFEPNATRAGVPIPLANLTRLPPIRLETTGVSAQCEPMDCEVRIPSGFSLSMAWADKPSEKVTARDGATLSRADARVLVTTAASDVTV